jgi:hypothetical protein
MRADLRVCLWSASAPVCLGALGVAGSGGGQIEGPSRRGDVEAVQDVFLGIGEGGGVGRGALGPVRTAGLRRQRSGGYFGSKTGNGVIKTFFRPDNPANYWASEVQKLVDGGGRVTIP